MALRFSPLGGRYDDPDRERAPLRGLARVLKCSLNGNLHRGYFLRAETHESVLKAANQPKSVAAAATCPSTSIFSAALMASPSSTFLANTWTDVAFISSMNPKPDCQ